jgi:hypothetical protein
MVLAAGSYPKLKFIEIFFATWMDLFVGESECYPYCGVHSQESVDTPSDCTPGDNDS